MSQRLAGFPGTVLATVALAVLVALAGCARKTAPIKIGLQGPMTGDYAHEGQGFSNAVRMLADQTNAAGGILGRKVQLFVEDDTGDPTQAALAAQRLVDAGVVAVIGAYNSTATEAASQIYNKAGILQITPASTAVRLTQKGFPRFFRVCFRDDRQGRFAAKFMSEVLAARRIGILHDNSTYGQGLALETRRCAEELGLTTAFYDAINPADKDFAPILNRIGAARLDAVFFAGYPSQFGLLLRQSREKGLTNKWIAGNACNDPAMVEIAGVANAAGAYFVSEPLPKDLDYPEAHKFIADYAARYREAPVSIWTLMAGEAFGVIRRVIESTQSTDPGVLATYMHESLKDMGGLTGPIAGFDAKGDRLGTIHLGYRIDERGEFVVNPEQPGP
jgi:branched-chain amino acid transport system substrate-binding protein